MCGPIFLGYQSHQSLRQPQTLWRCSLCGRQSHRPLDCCTRPNYHLCQPHGIVYASRRQLGSLISRVQTHIQSWLIRHRQPDLGSVWAQDEKPLVHESLNALLSDIEMVSQQGDFTEETHDDIRELQLR